MMAILVTKFINYVYDFLSYFCMINNNKKYYLLGSLKVMKAHKFTCTYVKLYEGKAYLWS